MTAERIQDPNSLRRTKIVATVGPASQSQDMIGRLLGAGVDVFRLNFSHGAQADHAQVAQHIRRQAGHHGRYVGILADLQGPKIRIGGFAEGSVMLQAGDPFQLCLSIAPDAGDQRGVSVEYQALPASVEQDDILLLDDGKLRLRVDDVSEKTVDCTVLIGGKLSSRKGVNKLGGGLAAPALTEKDLDDIRAMPSIEPDFVAVSFVSSAEDIAYARKLLSDQGLRPAIIAKIERAEVVADTELLNSIIDAADGVMVARGDLGVEVGDAQLIGIQKNLISTTRKRDRMVITATQMLDSMTHGDLPTRAEVSDVANAVMDGTDAVMLSGETAIGHDPAGGVRMMERIIDEAEPYVAPGQLECYSLEHRQANPITEAVSRGATVVADSLNADLIVIATNTGRTALSLSRLRGKVPIIAVTHRADTAGRISLLWGVTAVRSQLVRQSADALLQFVVQWGLDHNLLKSGQKIVIVGHTNWLGQGHDMLMVHEVPSV